MFSRMCENFPTSVGSGKQADTVFTPYRGCSVRRSIFSTVRVLRTLEDIIITQDGYTLDRLPC